MSLRTSTYKGDNQIDDKNEKIVRNQWQGQGSQSPNKLGQNDFEKNEIKSKLKLIFTHYCSLGDRTNVSILKSNKLRKLALESSIMDKQITLTYIDLLYKQLTQGKSQMNFNNFCNFLAKIATEKFPQISPSNALLKLIRENLQGLYDSTILESDLGKDLALFDTQIDEDCQSVLYSLQGILKKIHAQYFAWDPLSSQSEAKNNLNNLLLTFLKDFEISPNLITKSTALLLLEKILSEDNNQQIQLALHNQSKQKTNSPLKQPNVNLNFTLEKMMKYLVITSEIANNKLLEPLKSLYRRPVQKLISLFEKMELSKGFHSFEQKMNSTHTSSTSLLIPEDTLREILNRNQDMIPEELGCQHLMLDQSPQRQTIFYQDINKSPTKTTSAFNCNDTELAAQEVFQHYSSELHYSFVAFCQSGDPWNSLQMKTSKLMRLLRNAGLLRKRESSRSDYDGINRNSKQNQQIGIRDKNESPATQLNSQQQQQQSQQQVRYIEENLVDRIVAKLIGPNSLRNSAGKARENNGSGFGGGSSLPRGKIEYSHFLKIIEEIAKEIYPEANIQESVNQIITENILKAQLEDNKFPHKKITDDYIALHNLISEDKNMVNLMNEIHLPLWSYFKRYSFGGAKMNLSQYLQFSKDFEIFPNQLSKSQLIYIFSALSFISEQNASDKGTTTLKHGDDGVNNTIDSGFFVEAIVMSAVEIYTIEDNPIYRVLLLLEKMNSSTGPKIVQKQLGVTSSKSASADLLGSVRNKYSVFYDSKMATKQKVNDKVVVDGQPLTFEDLLDQGLGR